MTFLLVAAVTAVVLSGVVVYIQYIAPYDRLPKSRPAEDEDRERTPY